MPTPEAEPPIGVISFENGDDFDRYLTTNRVNPRFSPRAGVIKLPDGTNQIVIDEGYYIRGGVRPDQLPAIAVHERIEVISNASDPHLDATIAEYQYIFNQDGPEGLRRYHTNLCNLMGGLNDVRNAALKTVLGK